MTNTWHTNLENAGAHISQLDQIIAELQTYRNASAAEIAQYLRVEDGIELDIDAIRATLTRPYTLLPINEHEAWLIHWRGVKMPIFGWVVAQGVKMYQTVCDKCQSPNLITRSPIYDSELDRVVSEEFECTDCHNVWLVEYKGGLAERDILLSKTTRPFFFVAQHQLESFIQKGYHAEETRACRRRTVPARFSAHDSRRSITNHNTRSLR